jgi:hypothetical protein
MAGWDYEAAGGDDVADGLGLTLCPIDSSQGTPRDNDGIAMVNTWFAANRQETVTCRRRLGELSNREAYYNTH